MSSGWSIGIILRYEFQCFIVEMLKYSYKIIISKSCGNLWMHQKQWNAVADFSTLLSLLTPLWVFLEKIRIGWYMFFKVILFLHHAFFPIHHTGILHMWFQLRFLFCFSCASQSVSFNGLCPAFFSSLGFQILGPPAGSHCPPPVSTTT